MKIPFVATFIVGLALSAIPADRYGAQASGPEYFDQTTDPKKVGWMQAGMDAVRNQLKDPESAKFKEVYFFRGSDDIPMTCGQVNSKNSFGAFSGYQHFVSAGKVELTFLEEEVEGFADIWNRFCR